MTDQTYTAHQHGQYITNKSFADQIAKLQTRIEALELALSTQPRTCICVESVKPHTLKGWEIT